MGCWHLALAWCLAVPSWKQEIRSGVIRCVWGLPRCACAFSRASQRLSKAVSDYEWSTLTFLSTVWVQLAESDVWGVLGGGNWVPLFSGQALLCDLISLLDLQAAVEFQGRSMRPIANLKPIPCFSPNCL